MLRSPRARVSAAVVAALVSVSCGSDPSTAPPPSDTGETSTTTAAATSTSAVPAATTSSPPATTAPDTSEPDTSGPDTSAPDTSEPDTSADVTTTTIDPTFEAFQWDRMGIAPIEEGFLDVPLDYSDPDGEQISLYVVRHLARDRENRIGSLLVNPGGPGEGGSSLAFDAEDIYGDAILENFDIIGWDPRGTGESQPAIDCVDDYDPYFGIETGADTPEQEALLVTAATEFAQACAQRSGELLDHIETADSARDMDSIRAALQEDEITYFGWSYGTQLGATWATMFPDTVRAAVLDGAIDPTTGRVRGLVTQAAGFQRTLGLFLEDCSADESCPFNNGGDAEGAFAALLASLEANPIPTEEGRPPLNDGVFELGVAQALYSDVLWPFLAEALTDAQAGDGSGILALYDVYYGRQPDGTYDNGLEAYFAITCADDPPTAGVAEAVAARPEFEAVSSVGYTQAYELVVCAAFPPFDTEQVEITGAGAGPVMVVGNTGDPATPFEGSRVMAETLEEGFFVTVEANSHTGYNVNACINDAIESYLVDLEIPDEDLVC